MKGYPRWFLYALLSVLSVLLLSAMLLLPTTLVMRAEFELSWRLPHSARLWVSACHAAFGSLSLFMIGAIWSIHMRSGWRRHKHRVSGASLLALFSLLGLTAIGIYYLGESALANGIAYAHVIIGVGLLPIFAWHWWRGRRSRVIGA